MSIKKYKKRENQVITGIQLTLDTGGFDYKKWGGNQRCKAGDWIVNSDGDCYTVDQESFAKTYTEVAPGQYLKTATIWAEQVETAGFVDTKEGRSAYKPGDYIAYNNEDCTDSYAITKEKFAQKYRED